LQELEDANAFVTSLDARRFWFRYHRLFADLLALELRRSAPTVVSSLHRAAAEWHEQQGFILEAIRHAQAAPDWPLASRLLADHHIDLTFDGRTGSVAQLLSVFPDDVIGSDAELAVAYATVRLLDGSLERSAAYLDLARQRADTVAPERRPTFDLLLAEVSLGLARWRGDLHTVLETRPLVEAALAAQPPGERTLSEEIRSVALLNLGIAELWSARLDDARRDLEQALALARRAGRPWLEIACLGHLSIAGPLTGLSLSAGLELGEKAVGIADDHGWSEDPIVVSGLATGAMALLWLGRLDESDRWLDRAQRTLQPDGEPGAELIVHQARGLLRLSQGRLEEALGALRAAQRMQAMLAGQHTFSAAVQARLLQTQVYLGRLSDARAELAEISEEERNTGDLRLATAVVHLAEGEADQAIDVLAPVIDGSAAVIHRPSATTEAHVLDALGREQLGDQRAAEASLERALDAAEPEGIVLPFVLAPARELLERLPSHRTAHPTLRRAILDVLEGEAPRPTGTFDGPLDELSDAELRVARYLPSNLRTPEIAAELFVSTNTVRTHLRHIYAKLGVHGRAEAVDRARQLGLLAPSHRRR
jgi:LuxR family maltose regulon positive regulatory protein